MTHTPTPWDYVPSTKHHGPYVTSEFGSTICDLYTMSRPGEPSTASGGRSKPIHFLHEMAESNAAFIVRAVNSHEALVKALVAARKLIESEFGEWQEEIEDIDYALALAQEQKP